MSNKHNQKIFSSMMNNNIYIYIYTYIYSMWDLSLWTILQIIEKIFIIKNSKWNLLSMKILNHEIIIFSISNDFASFQWPSYMKMSLSDRKSCRNDIIRIQFMTTPNFFNSYFMILTFVLYQSLRKKSWFF